MEYEIVLQLGDTLRIDEVQLNLRKFDGAVSFAITAPPNVKILRQELVRKSQLTAKAFELV